MCGTIKNLEIVVLPRNCLVGPRTRPVLVTLKKVTNNRPFFFGGGGGSTFRNVNIFILFIYLQGFLGQVVA